MFVKVSIELAVKGTIILADAGIRPHGKSSLAKV